MLRLSRARAEFMAARIFISYRRDDVAGDARGVRNGLAQAFGQKGVFLDVNNLVDGDTFHRELERELDSCDTLVAIIGERWQELLDQRLAAGRNDYVRIEIATALARGIRVIPARVGHVGRMPAALVQERLPDDIRRLSSLHLRNLTHENFDRDVADMAKVIRDVRAGVAPPRPWGRIAAATGVLVAGGGVLAYGMGVPMTWTAREAAVVRPVPSVLPDNTAAVAAEAARKVAAAKAAAAQAEADRAAQVDATKADADQAAAAKAAADAAAARRRDPVAALVPGSGEAAKECAECPEVVVAPAGKFTMGSPAGEDERFAGETQVPVSIPAPFAVGRYAVTFAEWDACVADGGCNGYTPADQYWGRGKQPVINVNWNDAQAYVRWLSGKTGQTYRLLSESEREYVARAGTTTPFWWGKSISPAQANYDGSAEPYKGGSSKGEYRQRTVAVDSFKPNPWGLYNVHGNVWEWTQDCWNGSNYGNPGDGKARTSGDCTRHVLRGGSWGSAPKNLRSAFRFTDFDRSVIFGFRVARSVFPPRTL
jgi:formylglycine-generating enzyme required for sulfatase activity